MYFLKKYSLIMKCKELFNLELFLLLKYLSQIMFDVILFLENLEQTYCNIKLHSFLTYFCGSINNEVNIIVDLGRH